MMRSCAVCSRTAPAADWRTDTCQTRCETSAESGLSGAEASRSPGNPSTCRKGGDLLLKEVPLQGAEELFGLRQGQPEMLDALMVLIEDDDIGDGLFITLIVTDDKLQFDTHTGASPGSSDR
jgi:hypothetical protein